MTEEAARLFFDAWFKGHISWAKAVRRTARTLRQDYEKLGWVIPRPKQPFNDWRG
jgi:DNA modification methylase